MFKKRCLRNENANHGYWMSYSDLMAALLLVFILATFVIMLKFNRTNDLLEQETHSLHKKNSLLQQKRKSIDTAISDVKRLESVRKDIVSEVRNTLARQNIEVLVDQSASVIRIPEQTLHFFSRSASIPRNQETRRKLKIIGETLYTAITKNDRWKFLDTIFIEGHTDSRSLNIRNGNWGLSTNRAISLWTFFEKELNISVPFSAMKNYKKESLFSVSGYSSTRRVNIIERTESDYRANRRIDIRLTEKRASILEMENIKTKF